MALSCQIVPPLVQNIAMSHVHQMLNKYLYVKNARLIHTMIKVEVLLVNLAPLANTLRLVQPHHPTVLVVPRGNTSTGLLERSSPIVKIAMLVNTVLNLREVQIVKRVVLVDITMKLLKRQIVNLVLKENTMIKLLALRYPIVKVAALVNTVLHPREVQIVQSVPLVDITIKMLKRRLVNLAVKENTTMKLLAVRYLIVKVVVEEHTTTKKVSQVPEVVNLALLVHIRQLVQPH